MNIVECLNSPGRDDIEKALFALESGAFEESLLTDVYMGYALNNLDLKPNYKSLKFNARIKKILVSHGHQQLVDLKIRLKNCGPGKKTTEKVEKLKSLGLDGKIVAKYLQAYHYVIHSDQYSDNERSQYFEQRLNDGQNGWLKLTSLELKSLPKFFFVNELNKKNLILHLSRNPLSDLKGIGTFVSLIELKLEKIKIKSLPEEIKNLSKLELLNLNGTKLTSLPSEIGALKKLKTLQLQETKITEIPEAIGKCKSLKVLHLFGSSVESAPESLCEISGLELLMIRNTPLSKNKEAVAKLRNRLPESCKFVV